jgi:hypothetical protein
MTTNVIPEDLRPTPADALTNWRDGSARRAVVDFVARVDGAGGAAPVPVEQRVAVFDNDGTLWSEQPLPIQADFLFGRLAEMATADPSLAETMPWKAVVEKDYAWLGGVMTKHYAGDDSDLQVLAGGLLPQAMAYDAALEAHAAFRRPR